MFPNSTTFHTHALRFRRGWVLAAAGGRRFLRARRAATQRALRACKRGVWRHCAPRRHARLPLLPSQHPLPHALPAYAFLPRRTLVRYASAVPRYNRVKHAALPSSANMPALPGIFLPRRRCTRVRDVWHFSAHVRVCAPSARLRTYGFGCFAPYHAAYAPAMHLLHALLVWLPPPAYACVRHSISAHAQRLHRSCCCAAGCLFITP